MKRAVLIASILAGLTWAGVAAAAEPLLPPRTKPSARRTAAAPRASSPIDKQAVLPRVAMASDETTAATHDDEIVLVQDEAAIVPSEAMATDAPVVEDTAPQPLPADAGYGQEVYGGAVVSDGDVTYDGGCYGDGCDGYGGDCDACGRPMGLFERWCACGCMFESFAHETHSGRRVWVEAQALNWYTRPSNYPPLVTSSPAGTPQVAAGVLGQPTTSILFGNQDLDDDARFGGRINFGLWLIEGQFLALQGDYFGLEEEYNNFTATSFGNPILARPFYNVQTDTPDASILAGDNIIDPRFGTAPINLDGSIEVETHSRVQGAGLSLRKPSWVSFDHNYRVNWMAGYRWFRLDEGVSIHDVVFPQGGLFVPGSSFQTWDIFDTQNEFHGGEIGLLLEFRKSVWSLDLLGRLAMGNMRHRVDIQGYGLIDDTVNATGVNDGLLALGTNIGSHTGNEFCLIPEVGAKLGLAVTDYLRFTIGYNFMYISSVVRADDQIDLGLNLSQAGNSPLVGPARPAVSLQDTDFWVHGISVGAELKF